MPSGRGNLDGAARIGLGLEVQAVRDSNRLRGRTEVSRLRALRQRSQRENL